MLFLEDNCPGLTKYWNRNTKVVVILLHLASPSAKLNCLQSTLYIYIYSFIFVSVAIKDRLWGYINIFSTIILKKFTFNLQTTEF